jgi:hypothetical protein
MEKYFDLDKNPLQPGKHYLKISDIEGINPLFYTGKNLIDSYGHQISPEEVKGLFPINNEDAKISELEKNAQDFSRAALFMKFNMQKDLVSEFVTVKDTPGVDGS